MIRLMRLLLAISALVVTLVDPSQPDRFVELTYSLLISYVLYAGGIYSLSYSSFKGFSTKILLRIDVIWFLILVSLTSGTNSIFFFFFFFPILVASFRWGFSAGFRLTIVSAFLFTLIGYLSAPSGSEFELNRFMLRPIYLVILGYMISYWGEQEITSKRRLALLQQVGRLSNPRFGIDHTFDSIIKGIKNFYDAASVIMITSKASNSSFVLRETNAISYKNEIKADPTDATSPLLALPGESAIHYRKRRNFWRPSERIFAVKFLKGEQPPVSDSSCRALADMLDAPSFITIPLRYREINYGRIYVTSKRNTFVDTDIEFMSQLMSHVLPAIENIELLNQMASTVVEQQKKSISRDIHDSTIQPYIGLKLGLESLEIKNSEGRDISKDISLLLKIADDSIIGLRGFIKNLREEPDDLQRAVLIGAVKQLALKYKEYYGISVDVLPPGEIHLNDRLAAEVFQIVTEGLSNIRRHTNATKAAVKISHNDKFFLMYIENVVDPDNVPEEFVPMSITGRVEALGGSTKVIRSTEKTTISVRIPL